MTFKEILVLNDAKVQTMYGNAVAGKIWIALRPVVQLLFICLVFNNVIVINQDNHGAFIMYGFLLLTFINMSLMSSVTCIFDNRSIISRFKIKSNFFPIANIFHNLYLLIFCFIACALIIALFAHLPIHVNMIFAPFYFAYIVIVLFLVCASVAIIYPYFQDIKFLLEVSCMVSLWATPIFYPISQMPGWMFKISYFNPFFILIVPFVRLMHEGSLPTTSMHASMLGLLVVSLIVYIIAQKKLAKNVIYYC
ncbi:ABC transporter permease [Candidatus Deianiraea vastatrix]|uniref:Transport permease protein n=1 Tax=Candidatus Deianiraea vastatrix TaxID=2163644 RepID=A0A5B8XF18_9RICK|nr:ABC transporter permease [Candidatus Deianiraea vastatrix]QED23873.1 Putative ABC transporter permease [Candidatus Deianiraea vastatrix]